MIRRALILSLSVLLAACATRGNDRVELPAAPPLAAPGDLVGMTSAALKASLGQPAFRRKDGNVEMWRYAGANCQAFFFLYPERGTLKVQHVETLPRPVASAADTTCLRSLSASAKPVS